MAPPCCKIAIGSRPNPPPTPPLNPATPSTNEPATIPQDSEVTVTFKYGKFAELYMKFLDGERGDAEGWKKLMPFCETCGTPENLKAFAEIRSTKFRDLLRIDPEDWSAAWRSVSYCRLTAPRASATRSGAQKKKKKEDERNKKAAEKKVIKQEKEHEKSETKETEKEK
ncbi:hypothetical protein NW766_005568 [Fusarium irregulare]|uniref:Uncharacterized protein n=1 Tax=Fusarium irregulare TaxID=2494466 RepID=A0A9W8PRL5_9HYPO|nr:hypothetical protein NW766_005568 [Fusarium irregulare]